METAANSLITLDYVILARENSCKFRILVTCFIYISDTLRCIVRFFYDFWCNWRSLKPFLSRVILTHKDDDDDDDDDYGQITVWERELRAFLFS